MSLSYSDIIDKMKYHLSLEEDGYSIPMAPYLNKVIGNILPGTITAVSGMSGAGSTSFINQNYVLNTLIQWYTVDPDERPSLHIEYFSPKNSELRIIQQLICQYIKLVYGIIVDIPTLNNQPGKLYNVNDNKNLLKALTEAKDFFDEILDKEVLVITDIPMTPSGIYSHITDYMETIGKTDNGVFEYAEDFDGLVMLVVESVEDLPQEVDKFSAATDSDKYIKLNENCYKLKKVYGIHCVLNVPCNVGYVRAPKDTEPTKRQLGVFAKRCDIGIILYNPIEEDNRKFYEDSNNYIGSRSGAVLMRYWFVVRNQDGIDSAKNRMLFLPGVGYHMEYDTINAVSDVSEVEALLIDASQSVYLLD